MMKWVLLIVALYALPQTQCSLSPEDWKIAAPRKVQVIRGSCVLIPCSYVYIKTKGQVTGFWKKEKETVIAAAKSGNVHASFQGRTRLLGEVSQRNCTWMLESAQKTDEGRYFFRVETPVRQLRHSWVKDDTKLEVVEAPSPELRVTGETALCFVVHMCPQHPPTFHWSRDMEALTSVELTGTHQLDEMSFMTFSVVSFCPELNSTTVVRCTVSHFGGGTANATVLYP